MLIQSVLKSTGPGASSGGGDGNPVAAIDDATMEHASTRTKECRVSPAQTIARWPRPSAGAAPDFRYPPYDINALAFSSPAHSIRWAVKVSRATAPGFGSYVGV